VGKEHSVEEGVPREVQQEGVMEESKQGEERDRAWEVT